MPGEMRILLLAHDYPPIESPQGLRWGYLAHELCKLGHEVIVLCADTLGRAPPLPAWASGPEIMRIAPGGVVHGVLRAAARLRLRQRVSDRQTSEGLTGGFSWRNHVVSGLLQVVGLLRFPDARRAWLRPARKVLREWLRNNRPDIVISSHEPAVSLMLGEECVRRGLPWVVDLGDPVLTDYIPRHWRWRALALEARVCRRADALITTNDATRDLLSFRHRIASEKIAVVSQGFDLAAAEVGTRSVELPFMQRELHLLYAGRFYRFRSGKELFEAVLRTPGVVLDVVTPSLPRWLRGYAESHPHAIRVRQNLPHHAVLVVQRHADILVNLGNANPVQTPGKLYEYLGCGRPLLQVYQKASDPSNAFVVQLRRGWIVPAEVDALSEQLARLLDMKLAGNLTKGMDLSMSLIQQHAWAVKAAGLDKICRDARAHRCPQRVIDPRLAT